MIVVCSSFSFFCLNRPINVEEQQIGRNLWRKGSGEERKSKLDAREEKVVGHRGEGRGKSNREGECEGHGMRKELEGTKRDVEKVLRLRRCLDGFLLLSQSGSGRGNGVREVCRL